MMWSDKNMKKENYGATFCLYFIIGTQQQKAGEGIASLQVTS